MNKYYKFFPIILVLSFLSAGLIYCGGGGGGGTAAPDAFNFTEANMEGAASLYSAGSDLYFELSQLVVILSQVPQQLPAGPQVAPTAVIPIPGDLGLCENFPTGTSELSVDDADNNGLVSVGDTAILTITDCQLDPLDPGTGNGTLIFNFVVFDLVSEPQTVTFDFSLNVDLNLLESISANFRMQVDISGTAFNISITDQDDNDTIVFEEGGQTLYRLGCFDVAVDFDSSDPTAFTLTENGVVSIPGAGIMSFSSITPLSFVVPGLYPDDGATRIDSGGTCTALGAPDGASGADGSYIIFTAVPGDADDVTLELFDSSDTLLATVNTFYGDL